MSKWYKDFNSRTISVTNHNIYFVKKKKKKKKQTQCNQFHYDITP